jgi:hypothetical protein
MKRLILVALLLGSFAYCERVQIKVLRGEYSYIFCSVQMTPAEANAFAIELKQALPKKTSINVRVVEKHELSWLERLKTTGQISTLEYNNYIEELK